jgi:hypothetical protein
MSRTDAVEALYQDMAARHRSRFRSIHVRWIFPLDAIDVLKFLHRFLRSLNLRRLMMSSDPTLSNSSPRTSNSLFLTVYQRHLAPSCSSESVHQPSTKWSYEDFGIWVEFNGVALHMGCFLAFAP